MQAAILIVGDEILSGHTQDTNSNFLAKRLFALGVDLVEMRTVGDEAHAIQGALWELQERREAELVIVAGGLGPTHDDRTVAAVARANGRSLVLDEATWRRFLERHRQRHEAGADPRPAPDAATRKMALVPVGATVFDNKAGAAPGLALERTLVTRPGSAWTIVLPGVPRELETLWGEHIEPFVTALAGGRATRRHVAELVYHGYESEMATLLDESEAVDDQVTVGSYPQWGEGRVVLRLSGRDKGRVEKATERLVARLEEEGHRVERMSHPSRQEPTPT
ncbi:MAG: hypothetical protein KY455_03350 [Euryarchaeota archaeon]|nr:hypothetical protein [Euryarchaeota archaeon]